ncbi:hypothetical protein ACNGTP_04550 [Bisgaard Taxon 45]
MKLDKDFQDKFFSYLNSLSKDEIISIIEEPTVNVDFLAGIISFNNIDEMYKHYSINTMYNKCFSDVLSYNIPHLVNIKSRNYYNCVLSSVLSRRNLASFSDSSIIEEKYAIAANDNRYAIAA